jgi:hypothetical protein
MKFYVVTYKLYNDKLLENEWVAGNCYCPSAPGMWSFRLYLKTNIFKFLISDGPTLSINDVIDLYWGHKVFGHITVTAIINETN